MSFAEMKSMSIENDQPDTQKASWRPLFMSSMPETKVFHVNAISELYKQNNDSNNGEITNPLLDASLSLEEVEERIAKSAGVRNKGVYSLIRTEEENAAFPFSKLGQDAPLIQNALYWRCMVDEARRVTFLEPKVGSSCHFFRKFQSNRFLQVKLNLRGLKEKGDGFRYLNLQYPTSCSLCQVPLASGEDAAGDLVSANWKFWCLRCFRGGLKSRDFFLNGIKFAGRKYEFLCFDNYPRKKEVEAHDTTALTDKYITTWFFATSSYSDNSMAEKYRASFPLLKSMTVKDIRNDIADFRLLSNNSQFLRMNGNLKLGFSPTLATCVGLRDSQIYVIDDERADRRPFVSQQTHNPSSPPIIPIMTSGCGFIAADLAATIPYGIKNGVAHSRRSRDQLLPAVIQMCLTTFKGLFKGCLVVTPEPSLCPPGCVILRQSMKKADGPRHLWETEYEQYMRYEDSSYLSVSDTFEHPDLMNCSRPTHSAHLNRNLVLILAFLGVPGITFHEILHEHIDDVVSASESRDAAVNLCNTTIYDSRDQKSGDRNQRNDDVSPSSNYYSTDESNYFESAVQSRSHTNTHSNTNFNPDNLLLEQGINFPHLSTYNESYSSNTSTPPLPHHSRTSSYESAATHHSNVHTNRNTIRNYNTVCALTEQALNFLESGHNLNEPNLQGILLDLQQTNLDKLANCFMSLSDSIYIVGAPDPMGVLVQGEVFVSLPNDYRSKRPKYLEGPVLVTRNPMNHPGDIRKLFAVRNDRLEHHCSHTHGGVVFFSTRGHRSPADEMGGGDYDGDQFLVVYEKKHGIVNAVDPVSAYQEGADLPGLKVEAIHSSESNDGSYASAKSSSMSDMSRTPSLTGMTGMTGSSISMPGMPGNNPMLSMVNRQNEQRPHPSMVPPHVMQRRSILNNMSMPMSSHMHMHMHHMHMSQGNGDDGGNPNLAPAHPPKARLSKNVYFNRVVMKHVMTTTGGVNTHHHPTVAVTLGSRPYAGGGTWMDEKQGLKEKRGNKPRLEITPDNFPDCLFDEIEPPVPATGYGSQPFHKYSPDDIVRILKQLQHTRADEISDVLPMSFQSLFPYAVEMTPNLDLLHRLLPQSNSSPLTLLDNSPTPHRFQQRHNVPIVSLDTIENNEALDSLYSPFSSPLIYSPVDSPRASIGGSGNVGNVLFDLPSHSWPPTIASTHSKEAVADNPHSMTLPQSVQRAISDSQFKVLPLGLTTANATSSFFPIAPHSSTGPIAPTLSPSISSSNSLSTTHTIDGILDTPLHTKLGYDIHMSFDQPVSEPVSAAVPTPIHPIHPIQPVPPIPDTDNESWEMWRSGLTYFTTVSTVAQYSNAWLAFSDRYLPVCRQAQQLSEIMRRVEDSGRTGYIPPVDLDSSLLSEANKIQPHYLRNWDRSKCNTVQSLSVAGRIFDDVTFEIQRLHNLHEKERRIPMNIVKLDPDLCTMDELLNGYDLVDHVNLPYGTSTSFPLQAIHELWGAYIGDYKKDIRRIMEHFSGDASEKKSHCDQLIAKYRNLFNTQTVDWSDSLVRACLYDVIIDADPIGWKDPNEKMKHFYQHYARYILASIVYIETYRASAKDVQSNLQSNIESSKYRLSFVWSICGKELHRLKWEKCKIRNGQSKYDFRRIR